MKFRKILRPQPSVHALGERSPRSTSGRQAASLDGSVVFGAQNFYRHHFFIVPPGVASPFFSADPAVPAPCVLASLDGIELAEVPVVVPMLPELPPVAGVCCVVSLLGLVAAGPPDA